MSSKPRSRRVKSASPTASEASGHVTGELMRRYLPQLVLTGALLSPLSSWALGLGEIRLYSALNQPFDAETELISPTPEELQSLKVGLASADLFSRYGIDRPAYLSSFDFKISRSREDRKSTRLNSSHVKISYAVFCL